MNQLYEGCIGDLTALEAKAHKIAGIVLWGAHRDSEELRSIQLPTFTYGACPTGPQRLDAPEKQALESARFGQFLVTKHDFVFADCDGVLFVPEASVETVVRIAQEIRKKERGQAEKIAQGTTLIQQLQFEEYLSKRSIDSSYTFRKHLGEIGGAIER